jgi:hypothetical protein
MTDVFVSGAAGHACGGSCLQLLLSLLVRVQGL